ncbi:response regulator, partial [Streptomyces sp. NPDC048845]|uniref:response regulator n=1 Tax=Streptomyces sp. NPDC048845 TaxID=3155390 RepID=UPI0034285CE1
MSESSGSARTGGTGGAGETAGTAGAGEPAAAAPVRVMVVDDHPMWRDAVARDLDAAGYRVVATQRKSGG